ncbi:hypothetical protein A3D76_01880 [Candidatus Roizmanbacteria bacterium RIFCSPHIGHO2_02_FULL_37_9b]|nr:MAG: hypothetical protein A3D76_01880 [Candidatus Roizmanbacteria bacterium RIFCSPHIGHO2_02_FULL_37_9b]
MTKYVLLGILIIIILFFFFNRGFAYYDEGFILHAAQRVLQGEFPYKDFDLIYTPGTVYLTAAAFKIFGESILAGRILSLTVSLLACYLVYKICFRSTKNYFGSFFAVLIYLAWGPTHINFPWPSMFALTTGMAAIWFVPGFFTVGLMTFVTFLMKQNFGAAVLLSIVIWLLLTGKVKKISNLFRLVMGFSAGAFIFLIYLLITGSLSPFLNNFYFYTIQRFLLENVASTPFPSELKAIFYFIPAVVSLSVLILVRKKANILILPIFTLLFYLFGIRPTTDFVHLTTLMSLTGLPLGLLITNKKSYFPGVIISLLLIILGFQTAIFKNYYRWDSPIYKQNSFSDQTKAKIFVDQKFNKIIPEVIGEIKKNTTKNDFIFIFPNAPMFYFLSERKNPTRFINLPLGLHSLNQEREVVDNLKNKQVNLILTNEPPVNSSYPVISDYVLKNYLIKKQFFEFTLWEKVEVGKRSEVLNK